LFIICRGVAAPPLVLYGAGRLDAPAVGLKHLYDWLLSHADELGFLPGVELVCRRDR
jgi:hypothetical protein